MLKLPIVFFSFIWIVCVAFTLKLLFSVTSQDKKDYEKYIAYVLENGKQAHNNSMIQFKKNVKKEFFSENAFGHLTAKRATLIFDPKKKLYIEKLFLVKGEILQDGNNNKLQADKGTYDHANQTLTMHEVTTSFPYETENGKPANITSFSKKAVFALDPKNSTFSLEKTKGKIVQ